jgi:hypothetical protein
VYRLPERAATTVAVLRPDVRLLRQLPPEQEILQQVSDDARCPERRARGKLRVAGKGHDWLLSVTRKPADGRVTRYAPGPAGGRSSPGGRDIWP